MNIYAGNGRGVALFPEWSGYLWYASLLPHIDIGGNTNIIQVNVDYNGTVMTMTFKDTVTGGIASTNWTVNIPSVVGGGTAYIWVHRRGRRRCLHRRRSRGAIRHPVC